MKILRQQRREMILPLVIWISLGFALWGCAGGRPVVQTGQPGGAIEAWPLPVAPQPSADALKPGIAVTYLQKKIRHLGSMPDSAEMARSGYTGAPVTHLAHRFGEGEVFGSGVSRGICVEMNGLVQFPQAGAYIFKAHSNDGIRIFIDGRRIIDDPDVHGDRYRQSDPVRITQPGWYRLNVKYFQRKGTATLELYWKTPGSADFVIVPPAAYAHTPTQPGDA